MKTKEIVTISQEVNPIINKAQELRIKDDETMKISVEFLSILNKENDRLVEDREKLTKPLNEALKGIRAKYRPATDILTGAIDIIRSKMSDYQTAIVLKRKQKENDIANKISEGKLSIEKGVSKLDSLQVINNKTETENGSVKFRTDYILEVVNKEEIPLIYLEVNESSVIKALKEGINVPGAKLVEKLTPINNR